MFKFLCVVIALMVSANTFAQSCTKDRECASLQSACDLLKKKAACLQPGTKTGSCVCAN